MLTVTGSLVSASLEPTADKHHGLLHQAIQNVRQETVCVVRCANSWPAEARPSGSIRVWCLNAQTQSLNGCTGLLNLRLPGLLELYFKLLSQRWKFSRGSAAASSRIRPHLGIDLSTNDVGCSSMGLRICSFPVYYPASVVDLNAVWELLGLWH